MNPNFLSSLEFFAVSSFSRPKEFCHEGGHFQNNAAHGGLMFCVEKSIPFLLGEWVKAERPEELKMCQKTEILT